ncbi:MULTISPECIES: carbonic anhydrase family protein [unclassified Microbulbifer]|uniref:carbonic anhydrase n=1 Tax=unclassified Microbulbifer TaxID=2619833 RepID=UPI0027E47485|nr:MULTISPECIES: carbonic anhydrase family protein [unclassified Microbulbifer]
MQKLMVATGLFFASAVACAGDGAQWDYSGAKGPGHWGELSPQFTACSEGRNQSPINLSNFIESDLKPIEIHYQAGGDEILNNGHSVQVNYAPGSKISVDGHEFTLKQYHFHSPSENHINGKSFPMEAHLVHADGKGNLAVIAVMFEEGEANKALAKAWAKMPEKAGDSHGLPSSVAAEDILPSSRDYYRYNGSLTTPPCSEGVEWLVMKEPVSASKAQIEKFVHVMHHPNNRPIQMVGARPVLQ